MFKTQAKAEESGLHFGEGGACVRGSCFEFIFRAPLILSLTLCERVA